MGCIEMGDVIDGTSKAVGALGEGGPAGLVGEVVGGEGGEIMKNIGETTLELAENLP